jgi:hypothetical protein
VVRNQGEREARVTTAQLAPTPAQHQPSTSHREATFLLIDNAPRAMEHSSERHLCFGKVQLLNKVDHEYLAWIGGSSAWGTPDQLRAAEEDAPDASVGVGVSYLIDWVTRRESIGIHGCNIFTPSAVWVDEKGAERNAVHGGAVPR